MRVRSTPISPPEGRAIESGKFQVNRLFGRNLKMGEKFEDLNDLEVIFRIGANGKINIKSLR